MIPSLEVEVLSYIPPKSSKNLAAKIKSALCGFARKPLLTAWLAACLFLPSDLLRWSLSREHYSPSRESVHKPVREVRLPPDYRYRDSQGDVKVARAFSRYI